MMAVMQMKPPGHSVVLPRMVSWDGAKDAAEVKVDALEEMELVRPSRG